MYDTQSAPLLIFLLPSQISRFYTGLSACGRCYIGLSVRFLPMIELRGEKCSLWGAMTPTKYSGRWRINYSAVGKMSVSIGRGDITVD